MQQIPSVPSKPILVTGYTGRLGRLVADDLLRRGLRLRLLVRPTHLNGDWQTPPNCEICAGSFEDADSVAAALHNTRAVFLVSPVDPAMVARETTLVDLAAQQSEPPHIVKVSGLATSLDSYVNSGLWHARIEAHIRKQKLPATFLRPNYFMQNLAFQIASIRKTGLLRGAVEDAAIAMVDARDVAETAGQLLCSVDTAPTEAQALSLTADRTWTYPEIAEALSRVLERPVIYQRQSVDDVRAGLKAAGVPQWHIEILVQFNQAFSEGLGSRVSSSVTDLLGRPPRTLQAYLQELIVNKDSVGKNPFPS